MKSIKTFLMRYSYSAYLGFVFSYYISPFWLGISLLLVFFALLLMRDYESTL
jgi:hypothetical protein